MKRSFAIFGGLIFLLLVGVIGLAAWVLTFDANANKDWLAEKFKQQTGRELTLGGNIDVNVYPWLSLNADDVSISNAPGFSTAPMLQAGHVEFRIKLLPMLSGKYEIDTVKMDGLRVSLEVAGDGKNNWTMLASDNSGAQTSANPAASKKSGSLLNNLILGGVNITDTNVIYDDQSANTHYEIQGLTLSIGELVYGDPLDIRLSMDAASRAPQLNAGVSLEGTVVYDLDNGRYDLEPFALTALLSGPTVPNGSAELSLSTALHMDLNADTLNLDNIVLDVLGTHITAQVAAARVQTATPSVLATVQAEGNDLAVLFRIIEQNELAERIRSLDSSFSVLASVDADMRSKTINIPTLQAKLLNADISGEVKITNFDSATPVYTGNLNAAGPDLPTLIEVAGMLQGGRNSALSQAGRDLARVPDKSFRVQTRFDADMQKATVAVPEFYLSLFGATINGSVDASNINDTGKLLAEGKLNAQGPDLPLLMQIAGQLQGGRESALNEYGNKLRINVRNRAFTLSTDFNADLARGNIQLPALTAAMLGFRLNADLNARDMQGNNGIVSGSLSLAGENLKEVLTALDQSELAEVAQSMDLTLKLGGGSSNLRISPMQLNLVLAGRQIPNSPQTLKLNADTVLNLDNYSLQADAFSLSGLGLNLSGKVAATNMNAALSYSGEINLPVFNARQFLQQINQPLPPMTDPTVLQKVALSSAFGGTVSSFNLNNMKLQLDDSNISGSFAISDLASMATQFTVTIDELNADRYMAPATTAPTVSNAEATPLKTDQLQALNVDGSLKVGKLTINRLQMSDIEIQLAAANGDIALNPFKANLYSGTFNGDIRLNATGAVPSATISTTLNQVNLEPLLKDFMDATYVTGIANIQLSMNGNGADTAAIKRNLNGNGTVALQDGVLTGVDVSAVLNTVETMIRSRRLAQMPQGGSTAFEESSATLAIKNGVVTTNNLSIKAPGWKLAGSGTLIDLNQESINFNMLADVDKATVTSQETEYNLGGYTLPIACTGAISSPRCLPDAQQIITAAVSNVVQQRLGTLLQDRLGGTGQNAQPTTTPAPTEEGADPQAPPAQQQPPAEQLLNRALDRLLKKD